MFLHILLPNMALIYNYFLFQIMAQKPVYLYLLLHSIILSSFIGPEDALTRKEKLINITNNIFLIVFISHHYNYIKKRKKEKDYLEVVR